MHKLHLLPILTLLVGIIAVGIGIYVLVGGRQLPEVEPQQERVAYVSDEYGLSFTYSPAYYLKDRDAGFGGRPQLSVVLVSDAPENRAVIEGKSDSQAPRETPPSITVEVYQNPDNLPAEDWVRADTNWTVRTSEAAPFGKGSLTGVTYSWDGLYQGKSYIATKGDHAYVFAVTSMSPEDAILGEFNSLLASVGLADIQKAESIEDYIRAHITDLSPEKASMGGTFYVTNVEAGGGTGTVSYEDGHNNYIADFAYTISESGSPKVTSFTVRQ